MAFAVADASTYRTGYQTTLVPDTVLRGSLPLSPQERGMHHTVQESVGTNHVAMAAILQLDLRGSADLPVRLSSGNDNSAAVKNISKPGNKPQMVLHQVETQLEARARHVIVVGQKQSKYFMDHQTNIDWDGRRLYRYPDLGLHPQLVQLAAKVLGKPIDESTVDMMACRVTRQTRHYVSRYPDGDTDRITQCDVQTFHLGEHHLLSDKNLYIYPPEVMLEKIAQQVCYQQRDGQSILLVYPLWVGYSWMSLLEDRIENSVLIPHDERNWVHPAGAQQTDESGRPKWPLIMSSLSSKQCPRKAGQPRRQKPFAQVTATERDGQIYFHSKNLPNT